ncbi:unnamed protein product [Caenorhabditis brenneri]
MADNLKLLILAVFAVVHVLADPYNCAGTQTINPPANINNSWNYPDTYNSSQTTAPQYAANQNCSWIINVPKGMFAYFTLKVDTNNEPVLTLIDSVSYTTVITSASPFFLLDPLFRVDLQATKIGSLGMTVTWYKVNPAFPNTVQVHSNGSPLMIFAPDFDNGTVIQSDTRVNLLALPPTMIAPDVSPFMRNTQIYDGPNIDSTHLGNLYQVLTYGKSLVSTGKYLTIYSLFPGFGTIENSVIVQDYFDVKDFKSYKAINCNPMISQCQFSLDARQGTAAAIRYYPTPMFIKDVSMPQTNVLSVYTNFVTPAHKLVDYTSTNSKTNCPQKINGVFTSFVLNADQADVTLNTNAASSGWATGFNGRRGFFYSPNYSYNSSDQNFSDSISSTSISNITYTVERAAITGDATLNVIVSSNRKSVLDTTYSATNFPSGPVQANGDTISGTYKSNGAWTTGAFVSFGFDKYNSASTNGILIGIIVCIWRAIFV